MPFMSSRGMFSVPLKFMCSTQCDTPVRPGISSPDPTRYQHQTDTRGAVCSSCTITFSPLSRNTERTPGLYRPILAHPLQSCPSDLCESSSIGFRDGDKKHG